jgi:hypothetical protein
MGMNAIEERMLAACELTVQCKEHYCFMLYPEMVVWMVFNVLAEVPVNKIPVSVHQMLMEMLVNVTLLIALKIQMD